MPADAATAPLADDRSPHAPGPAPGGPAVVCRDLVVRYGDRTAVDRLSLSAERGEVLAILGPNGAGKTSTVECLEGFRRPAEGSVRVLGLDPVGDHRALVPRIGVMLQRGGVYPMLGPRRALELFASYYDRPEDPGALLALVRLESVDRTPWRQLSGGEQARLSLALCLVGHPEVVFLDEPTAGVDPAGRLAVRDVVRRLRDRGACVVLTTHELGEAEQLADRVIIIHRGASVAEGTPAGLASSAGGADELSFGAPSGLDVAALAHALGAAVVEQAPGRYRVAAGASPQLTATLATWLAARDVALTDLRVGRSLEETYLAVVGAEPDANAGSAAGPAVGRDGGAEQGRTGPQRSSRRRRQGSKTR
jgi:ABC-2 type transport system ATP-binding protein